MPVPGFGNDDLPAAGLIGHLAIAILVVKQVSDDLAGICDEPNNQLGRTIRSGVENPDRIDEIGDRA